MMPNEPRFFECPLRVLSRNTPNTILLDDGHKRWSCLEWDRVVSALAAFLKTEKNLSLGDRVILISVGTFSSITMVLALWRIGAIVCPLSPLLTESQREQAKGILKACFIWNQTDCEEICGSARCRNQKIPLKKMAFSAIATIFSSSGSSGNPKYIVHSYGNYFFSAKGVQKILNISEDVVWGMSLPFYHMGGFSLIPRALLTPFCLKIPADKEGWRTLLTEGVTHLSFVPTQLKYLLSFSAERKKLKNLKALIVGGACLSQKLLEESRRQKIPLWISYGSTESCSQVCTRVSERENIFSLDEGKNPFVDIRLAKDGEILLKGQTLFQGYYHSGGLEKPFDDEGWFASGDMATKIFGSKSLFFIRGRKDSMIISGGENIYPEEIANLLLDLDSVVQVKIVSCDDETFGQRFIAFIDSPYRWKVSYWKDYLARHIEKFKIPAAFYPWSERPRQTMKECVLEK